MSKLKISSRLAIAFLLILILIGMEILVDINQSNQTSGRIRFVREVSQQSLSVLQVNNDLNTLKADLQQSLTGQNAAEITARVETVRDQLLADMDGAITSLQAIPELQAGHKAMIEQLSAIRAEFSTQVNRLTELANAGDWGAAELQLQYNLDQFIQTIQEIARQVNIEVVNEQMNALEMIESSRQQALLIFTIAGLMIIGFSGFLGYAVTRSITDPLTSLEQSAQALSRGDFEHRIQIKGQDELSILSEALNKAATDLAGLYASLEEKVRQRTEELNRRALQAETLYQGGRALSGTLNLNELLDLILFQLGEIIPYDRTSLMLQDGEALKIVAQRGFPNPDEAVNLRVGIKNGDVFEDIYHTQQPLAIDDVTQRADWQQVEGIPQARSWLGIPLIRSDKVIGMLSITREICRPFSPDEITRAATFAGQAALAIDNAQLYENLARFNQQLEIMVTQRTEQLSEAYKQLNRLDRTKSDFIGIASHELRTPLTVLRGYSQMLVADPTIQANEMLTQLANGIYSGAGRMHEVVNSMLDMVKIDSRALVLTPEPLSMGMVIKDVVARYSNALRERKLTLVVVNLSVLPPIEVDQEAIYKVFQQLVNNAIKYTPDGGKITISGFVIPQGSLEFPDGGIEVLVKDTGIGIDPQYHELIFSKFYQTGEAALHSTGQTKFKGGGPGLGLTIARGVIEAHQGKLWVESPGCDEVNCPGSEFHIALPLRQRRTLQFEGQS